MEFPFMTGIIDRCIGWIEEAPLPKIHVLYSELVPTSSRGNRCKGCNVKELLDPEYQVGPFKRLFGLTFTAHCNSVIYMLKLQLLDSVLKLVGIWGAACTERITVWVLQRACNACFQTDIKRKEYMHEKKWGWEAACMSWRLTQACWAWKEKVKRKV